MELHWTSLCCSHPSVSIAAADTFATVCGPQTLPVYSVQLVQQGVRLRLRVMAPEQAEVHLLPCNVGHTGEANVSSYFRCTPSGMPEVVLAASGLLHRPDAD